MQYKRKTKRKKNKKVRNATPLKYNGIQFKSKLEQYCYKKLKEANLLFHYEEVKFELMPSFTFENDSYELYKRKGVRTFGPQRSLVRAMTYTPDFTGIYKFSSRRIDWVIETKGNPNDAFPLRWKLFKYHIYYNQLDIDLFMPRNQKQVDEVVEIIKSR